MHLLKWQLNFDSSNFVWNHTCDFKSTLAARLFDFKIISMISDQITLHSVQLPLLIIVYELISHLHYLLWLCHQGFRVTVLGWPRGGFVVEHFLLSRAHIGSNFDQFLKKNAKIIPATKLEHSFITFVAMVYFNSWVLIGLKAMVYEQKISDLESNCAQLRLL